MANTVSQGSASAGAPILSSIPNSTPEDEEKRHRGVLMTGEDGEDGPKAFYIAIEARSGKADEVVQMLRDIFGCVQNEPATGPWYAIQFAPLTFGIFEAFPNVAGRDAHVAGGGGDIFRDLERMNDILARPAHVQKVDVLLCKRVFAG